MKSQTSYPFASKSVLTQLTASITQHKDLVQAILKIDAHITYLNRQAVNYNEKWKRGADFDHNEFQRIDYSLERSVIDKGNKIATMIKVVGYINKHLDKVISFYEDIRHDVRDETISQYQQFEYLSSYRSIFHSCSHIGLVRQSEVDSILEQMNAVLLDDQKK